MAGTEDLYLVGDDFDAVLAILEDEEELEEQFTEAVDSVSIYKRFILLQDRVLGIANRTGRS